MTDRVDDVERLLRVREEGAEVADDLVSLVDLAPTLLDAADVSVPDRMHGHSLFDVLAGGVDRSGVFVQVSESEICGALRTDRWKYAVSAPLTNGWRGGMGEPSSDTYLERYLYDLRSDPTESVNLVGRADYHDVAVDLRERLRERIATVEGEEPSLGAFKNPGYREY